LAHKIQENFIKETKMMFEDYESEIAVEDWIVKQSQQKIIMAD
jgi:hypothetical protein